MIKVKQHQVLLTLRATWIRKLMTEIRNELTNGRKAIKHKTVNDSAAQTTIVAPSSPT